jgi:hypothetical protein
VDGNLDLGQVGRDEGWIGVVPHLEVLDHLAEQRVGRHQLPQGWGGAVEQADPA